jgi:CDP-diglyceride synthetase
LIINVFYIIFAFIENNSTSDWILVFGILAISIIASIIGARFGKRNAITDNS